MNLATRWVELVEQGPRNPQGRLAHLCLRGMSVLYGLALDANLELYRRSILKRHPAGLPVISVGNLTLGGTGKTTFTQMLARRLLDLGQRPAILLRAYKRGLREHCDEYEVYRAGLPEVVQIVEGRNRVASAARARSEGATVALLDDGHQYLKLAKDLRILLFDCTQPRHLDWLFPAGMLRQPVSHVAAADLVCLTRCDQAGPEAVARMRARLQSAGARGDFVECAHRPSCLVDGRTGERLGARDLAGQRVVAVSGIGNNDAFARTVASLGMDMARHLRYPDHHAFTAHDADHITAEVESRQVSCVVTTEKDAPRLAPVLRRVEFVAIRVEMEILSGADLLGAQLASIGLVRGDRGGAHA